MGKKLILDFFTAVGRPTQVCYLHFKACNNSSTVMYLSIACPRVPLPPPPGGGGDLTRVGSNVS